MYIDGKEVKKIQAEEGTIVRANDSVSRKSYLSDD
jgi:hypothetical protein